MKQGFTNIEHNIQDAIQVAYGGTPKAKYVCAYIQLDCMFAFVCIPPSRLDCLSSMCVQQI